MSIRTRLLLLILFATLIPAPVGGMQFHERCDSEIAAARQDLAVATRQAAQELKGTIRGTAQLHYRLPRARDFDTPHDRAARSAFDSLATCLPGVGVGYLRILCSSRED